MSEPLMIDTLDIEHGGSVFRLSTLLRRGTGPTILYLHGLGSSKHDARILLCDPALAGCTVAGFDFPGCGRSPYPPSVHLGIEDLAALASSVAERLDLGRLVLIGHSLGGAAGLLLAAAQPDRVDRFINVEGNLAAEDCFMSREAASLSFDDFAGSGFMSRLESRFLGSPRAGDRIYGDTFRGLVDPRAFHDYTRSLVARSDTGELLDRFRALPLRRAFMYGAHNSGLSYLPRLREAGIRLLEAPDSGHWPMYDDMSAFARMISSEIGSP